MRFCMTRLLIERGVLMSIVFSLGSQSKLKLAAVMKALRAAGLSGPELVCVSVPSGVNAQPVGFAEIASGANNRATAAMAAVPGSLGIGIESGLIYDEEAGWADVAMVVIKTPDGQSCSSWSKPTFVPASYVLEAKKAGFAGATFGQHVAALLGGAADDPITTLTKGEQSREKLLAEAAASALGAVALMVGASVRDSVEWHDVRIGKVSRRLPVREVAPGVRVALFNILGDWVLTEAAGKALATRLHESGIAFDAMVMPDGKATALLHVLGRELRLPTFVARKERKPYMGDAVRSVSYRSITTNREQSLFLSAEDAAALNGKNVIVVDDVVSTGGTIDATKALMSEVGAKVSGLAAIFCEGKDREDVCSLGLLPLF